MGRHTDHNQLAAEALLICESVRELAPIAVYRDLTRVCAKDPERAAQLLMCLAAWVDFEGPTSRLTARAEAIVDSRLRAIQARFAS
ncbi:hypothetical protein [Nocardia sp. NPDC046763]|uniref:hypothetical protein n=1 Tax=Nocardia sp. NPDC046763 TaxID=3155256 RepID=UPI0033FD353C